MLIAPAKGFRFAGIGKDGGQALTEYVVVAGLLMATMAILSLLLVVFKEYGWRVYELVSSEYP